MKPYGSRRSFDTEPRIKSGRALVKREGEAVAEEQLAVDDEETDSGPSTDRRCKHCNGELKYDDCHDAFYCFPCDMWAEKMCADYFCTFCKNRPDSPSGRLGPRLPSS